MKRAEPTWGRFSCEQQSSRSLRKERHPTFISTTPPQLLLHTRKNVAFRTKSTFPNSQQPRTHTLATKSSSWLAWHGMASYPSFKCVYIFTMDLPSVWFCLDSECLPNWIQLSAIDRQPWRETTALYSNPPKNILLYSRDKHSARSQHPCELSSLTATHITKEHNLHHQQMTQSLTSIETDRHGERVRELAHHGRTAWNVSMVLAAKVSLQWLEWSKAWISQVLGNERKGKEKEKESLPFGASPA